MQRWSVEGNIILMTETDLAVWLVCLSFFFLSDSEKLLHFLKIHRHAMTTPGEPYFSRTCVSRTIYSYRSQLQVTGNVRSLIWSCLVLCPHFFNQLWILHAVLKLYFHNIRDWNVLIRLLTFVFQVDTKSFVISIMPWISNTFYFKFICRLLPSQMSELLTQKPSVKGKAPSGYLNAIFGLSGDWFRDTADSKYQAFDGYFISFYYLHLTASPLTLKDEVKKSVPPRWDPASLSG